MKLLTFSAVSGLVALAAFGLVASATPQFKPRGATESVNPSSYPADIQKDYRTFANKCSECHGLAPSLKQSRSAEGWADEVYRMQAMASSHISNKDAQAILAFLSYKEAHRKPQAKPVPSVAPSTSVEAGRTFYYAQSCDACHSISGKGGQAGPPLDNVANRRSREELVQRMQERRAGAVMPPLPADTTDQQINDLVEFLLTLKGK